MQHYIFFNATSTGINSSDSYINIRQIARDTEIQ